MTIIFNFNVTLVTKPSNGWPIIPSPTSSAVFYF